MRITDIVLDGKIPRQSTNIFLSTFLWLIGRKNTRWNYEFNVEFSLDYLMLTSRTPQIGDEYLAHNGLKLQIVKGLGFRRFVLRTKKAYLNPPFVGQKLIKVEHE